MSSVDCPQTIRVVNRKHRMSVIWTDPHYQEITGAFLAKNPVCEYCGNPSSLVHHDSEAHYKSLDAYYDPANFTACCGECHRRYRQGFVICPACLKEGRHGYMQRGAEQCSRHRVGGRCSGIMLRQRVFKKAVVHGEWRTIRR